MSYGGKYKLACMEMKLVNHEFCHQRVDKNQKYAYIHKLTYIDKNIHYINRLCQSPYRNKIHIFNSFLQIHLKNHSKISSSVPMLMKYIYIKVSCVIQSGHKS